MTMNTNNNAPTHSVSTYVIAGVLAGIIAIGVSVVIKLPLLIVAPACAGLAGWFAGVVEVKKDDGTPMPTA